MDQKQLRALVAVGEHRSFSAAAKALGTVQSNVSTHVSRLETELGVVLVDRGNNELTEEGRLVAARARRIENELAALVSDVAAMRDVVAGTVRTGVIGTTARWLVPPLLTRLKDRYPAVRVVILDATTSSLALQLAGGQIDLVSAGATLSEQGPWIRRGGRRQGALRPILLTHPPFKDQVVCLCPEVTAMSKGDLLIEDIVRKDGLDGPAIALVLLDLDHVDRHGC